jgi:hypothetical protein
LSRTCRKYARILAFGLLLAAGFLVLGQGCIPTDESKTPHEKQLGRTPEIAAIDTAHTSPGSPAGAAAPAAVPPAPPEPTPSVETESQTAPTPTPAAEPPPRHTYTSTPTPSLEPTPPPPTPPLTSVTEPDTARRAPLVGVRPDTAVSASAIPPAANTVRASSRIPAEGDTTAAPPGALAKPETTASARDSIPPPTPAVAQPAPSRAPPVPGASAESPPAVQPPPRVRAASGSTPPHPVATAPLVLTPPRPDSLPGSVGLWAYATSMYPADDATLYYLASGWWSRETIRREGLLKPEIQAREDSIPSRLFIPRFTGAKRQDLLSPQVAAQLDSGTVELWTALRETTVGPRVRLTQADYLRRLTRRIYREQTVAEAARGLKTNLTASSRRGLVKIDLPVELPSQLQSIFGEGKPNLSVRGSERITFAGTSRWRPNEIGNEIAQKQSKFPQLDMKQELNLQLTGTIGDKVSVDVDQSSQAATPLANRIKIRYKGYEDEIIQRVDLGNTSLSLPGTNYVTYGGTAQGLFGINAQARLGPVDITSILSKQEAKNDTKSQPASADPVTKKIYDFEYVAAKYFFLQNPDSCLWELDPSSLEVYIDDGNGTNDQQDAAAPGRATVDGAAGPDSLTHAGMFRLLPSGEPPAGEYQVEKDRYTGHPVLVLNSALEDGDALAVRYTGRQLDRDLRPVEPAFTVGASPPGGPLRLKMLRPSQSDRRLVPADLTQGVWAPVHNLELKNIYDLGGRGILKEGFECKIRLQKTTSGVQPDAIGSVTFLQMTGLDLAHDVTGGEAPGSDGRIDADRISLLGGTIMFPDLRPFDPSAIDLGITPLRCPAVPFYRFLPWRQGSSIYQARPAALPGLVSADSAATFRAPSIYDRVPRLNQPSDSRYYLELTFRSPVSRIQLNAFGILPGSESVTANSRVLVRDVDYRIDYDLGEVEILPHANVTEQEIVNVTYSYQGFGGGGGSKTLAGLSASYKPESAQYSGSTSWLYESKGGVPGLEGNRPRLGQEPSRTLVGEFAGTWKTDSDFLTSLIDALPGIDARLPSKLDVGFGAGISLPNPNTKGKLYIDDFDGVKDVLSLSMNRRQWRPASIPLVSNVPGGARLIPADRDSAAAAKGELWWFSPRNSATESDFQPTLETREGDDIRQVLKMRFFPRGTLEDEKKDSWGGIVQVLSTSGTDLSRAQFLDIWVNDSLQYTPHPSPLQQRHGKLVIDIGTVSEDAMWYRNDPARPEQYALHSPNGKLDTEDINGDGRLDQGTDLNEDLGLDRLKYGTPGADPFDVYHYDESDAEGLNKYASVNGTEGNQELDSEDLNGNGRLDPFNSYFQVAIDLADSTLWETDVYRDYVFKRPGGHLASPLDPGNGWRRIRIPLHNDTLVTGMHDISGAPAWDTVSHLRVWLTGFDKPTTIEIGGIEITGNRWFENKISDRRDRPLPDSLIALGEEFFVGVVNNKDDAAIYAPPFTVGQQDNITEREQSIALNVRNFAPGHRVSIFRSYPQRQDYTLYENMEFYLKNRVESGGKDLDFAIRLCRDAGSDTSNYYEYRRPVPADWELTRIDFAELSRLQTESPDSAVFVQDLGGGVSMTRKGKPSLNSVQRIVMLCINRGDTSTDRGSVWIDELHLTGVKKDMGLASRLSVNADLTGLGRVSFNMQRNGADFLKIGQDRGSGTTATNWSFNGSTELFGYAQRLGITAPISGSINSSRAVPKFQPNSDLVLKRASDRDISVNRTQDISVSLAKRPGQTWWGRYIVEPFSVSASQRTLVNRQPTTRENTVSRSAGASWIVPLEQWLGPQLGFALRKDGQTKVLLIPTSISASLAGSQARSTRYSATDIYHDYTRQPSTSTSSRTLGLSLTARPVTPVSYKIDTSRNLGLRERELRWLGLNLGREVNRRHQLTGIFPLPVMRQVLAPSVNWSGSSNLNFAQQGRIGGGLEEPAWVNDFANSRSITYNARLSPSELGRWIGQMARGRGQPDSTRAKTPAPAKPAGGLGRFLRLNTINSSYVIAHSTSFSRRTGQPDLLYQLGIADQLGSGVQTLAQASNRSGTTKSLTFDSNAQLPAGVTVTARYSRNSGSSSDNGLGNTNLTRKWPDLSVNWGNALQKLRLDRFFKSLQATTNYNSEYQEQGKAGAELDQVTRNSSFAPFLNLSASTRSGISATFSSSSRTSSTERFRPAQSISSTTNRQFGLGLKKSVSLTRTVTVPLTGQTKALPTRLDLRVDFDWKADRSETRSADQRPTVNSDRVNWSLRTGGDYQFTTAITGSGEIRFGQETDKKTQSLTARFIGISVSAAFTF